MARTYAPKKIELQYEVIKLPKEELQDRLDDAFAILFEETWKYLKENGQMSLLNLQREEVIINAK